MSAPEGLERALYAQLASTVSSRLPQVLRWRKLVHMVSPPAGAHVSTPVLRSVADSLANHADRNGASCYPSVSRLASEAGCAERSVQYALGALEELGLLARDSRGGRGRATRYTLQLPVDKPGGNGASPS